MWPPQLPCSRATRHGKKTHHGTSPAVPSIPRLAAVILGVMDNINTHSGLHSVCVCVCVCVRVCVWDKRDETEDDYCRCSVIHLQEDCVCVCVCVCVHEGPSHQVGPFITDDGLCAQGLL